MNPETHTSPQSITSSIEPLTHSSPEDKVADESGRLIFDDDAESGGRPSDIFQGLLPQFSDSTLINDDDVIAHQQPSHPVQSNVVLMDDKQQGDEVKRNEEKFSNCCSQCHHRQPLILLVNDPATLASIIHCGGNSLSSSRPCSSSSTQHYLSGKFVCFFKFLPSRKEFSIKKEIYGALSVGYTKNTTHGRSRI